MEQAYLWRRQLGSASHDAGSAADDQEDGMGRESFRRKVNFSMALEVMRGSDVRYEHALEEDSGRREELSHHQLQQGHQQHHYQEPDSHQHHAQQRHYDDDDFQPQFLGGEQVVNLAAMRGGKQHHPSYSEHRQSNTRNEKHSFYRWG